MNILDTLTSAAQDAAKGAAMGSAAGPIGAVAGGLGGLVVDIAPEVGRWLFGSAGEKTAGLVAQAVETVTGTPDADAAQTKLKTDPEAATQLRVQLRVIAAQQQAEADRAAVAERAAALARMQVDTTDRAGARGQTSMLAQARSALAWAPALLSGLILTVFGGVVYVVIHGNTILTPSTAPLANVLLGTVAAMATQVANYWLGSSSGSVAKSDQISAMNAAALSAVPGEMVHRLLQQAGPAPTAKATG